MNRQIFRGWGAGLDDVAFAQALAAAGVLDARAALRNGRADGARDIALLTARLDEAAQAAQPHLLWIEWTFPMSALGESADMLAAAWRASMLYHGLYRLEVWWTADESAEDVIAELSRPEVGLGSVYHRVDEPAGEARWQWPLRVALLDDPRSRALRRDLERAMEEHAWVRRLVVLDAPRDAVDCDLLILPLDLRSAVIAALEQRQRARADCTVVLGRNSGTAIHRGNLLRTLRSSVRTAGVALSHVPRAVQRHWFVELIRELSHAQTIDVALYRAAYGVAARAPYIAAARKLVELSDLAEQVRRMGQRFARRGMSGAKIVIEADSAVEFNLGLAAGEHDLGEVAASLENIARDHDFMSESAMATAAAELNDATADMEPAQQEARWIQAQVRTAADGSRLVHTFVPDAPHRIDVHIGPRRDEWIAPAVEDAFPSELLPDTGTSHLLTVLLSEPQLMEQPQLATLELPRAGASTPCSFHVFVPAAVRHIAARIVVLYDNRVLQTAVLRGTVATATAPDTRITLEIEAVVRATLSDLDARSRFDGALVLNNDARGVPRITAIADDDFRAFPVSTQLGAEIRWFDERLTQVAYERALFDALDKPDTVELLRDFARHGRNLYGHIVRDQVGSGGLARGERIHVVSLIPEDRLPVEFIYDRPTPGPDATLCPGAAEALRRGACDAACPHDSADPCICPLGFWGVRKIIERHAHDPALTAAVGAQRFGFAAEPLRQRRELTPLSCGMVGGTKRVDDTVPDGFDRISTRLAAVTSKSTQPVRTLRDWRAGIQQQQPALEVLIVHTEAVSSTDPMPRLEMGDGDWLAQVDLDERYITPARDSHAPIVLLLGCETAAPETDFAGLVAACRASGAAIVVAAGAKIHSEHAVRVAEAFVDALARAVQHGPVTFGEVMRTVRRELLAEGQPMVLTLSAYGDADWSLTC